ncbi:MAG: transposase, partial [Dictyoglomus sp.]
MPILLIPVKSDSFSKLRWKSEVNLIIYAISLLLPILPKKTVFVFDREFTYPELMKFLIENEMYFIIRLKRNVYVNGKPLWKLGPGIYENV